MTLYGIKYIVGNVASIKDGQAINYAILQTAHRLEKGLCIRTPRAGWGVDKANNLVRLLEKESKSINPDTMALSVGKGVLAAYIEAKQESDNPIDVRAIEKLRKAIAVSGLDLKVNEFGGSLLIHREDMIQDSSVERLFVTRHSVRDFSDIPVDLEKLERAITLALRAPSACNRQASQIYVIGGKDRIKAGSNNDYHADKYLIITSNMKAYNLFELDDWLISTSVFCGYLSLALHAEGIGSCVFRKEIIGKSNYNDAIRAMCQIPDDEQIILEMAIGNYKEEFLVPVSYRREAKDVMHLFI